MRFGSEDIGHNGFHRFDDLDTLARAAAQRLVDAVNRNPNLVLCLPTGRTPKLTYQQVVRAYNQGDVSFAEATIFIVDEYLGLGPDDPGSFARYMRDHLFDHIDIAPERVHVPDGKAKYPVEEANRYEQAIREAGGIGLLTLGVGTNGHIGFNEPGSQPDGRTQIVDLSPETLDTNRKDLPIGTALRQAVTIGIGTILDAQQILLLASGPSKKEPLKQLFKGGNQSEWPVVTLRKHDRLTVFFDAAADPEAGLSDTEIASLKWTRTW